MKKKLQTPGKHISIAEVQNVSPHGLWILVDEKEYFLPFDEYPWFQDATISQICDIEYQHGKHLHWPSLDVDLEIDSLDHPEAYPLIYKA